MLLLRTEINSGWVDIDIMEMPRQDKLGLHKYSTIRFQEGRIQFEHDGKFFIVKVAQLQHGGTLLRLAWDFGTTRFSNSATLKGELVSTGGDHSNLPLGFVHSLLTWGASLVWKDVQQQGVVQWQIWDPSIG